MFCIPISTQLGPFIVIDIHSEPLLNPGDVLLPPPGVNTIISYLPNTENPLTNNLTVIFQNQGPSLPFSSNSIFNFVRFSDNVIFWSTTEILYYCPLTNEVHLLFKAYSPNFFGIDIISVSQPHDFAKLFFISFSGHILN